MKEKKVSIDVTQAEFARMIQEAESFPPNSTIRKVIDRKIDAMVKREMYSDIMKATTDAERDAARKIYLDKIGVPESVTIHS
jgi:hypothetical protein